MSKVYHETQNFCSLTISCASGLSGCGDGARDSGRGAAIQETGQPIKLTISPGVDDLSTCGDTRY